MHIPLVGWHIAGWAGCPSTLVVTLVPSATLTVAVAYLYQRHPRAAFGLAIRRGLTPLTIGLVFASGWILLPAVNHDWRSYVLTAVTVGRRPAHAGESGVGAGDRRGSGDCGAGSRTVRPPVLLEASYILMKRLTDAGMFRSLEPPRMVEQCLAEPGGATRERAKARASIACYVRLRRRIPASGPSFPASARPLLRSPRSPIRGGSKQDWLAGSTRGKALRTRPCRRPRAARNGTSSRVLNTYPMKSGTRTLTGIWNVFAKPRRVAKRFAPKKSAMSVCCNTSHPA